MPSPLELIIVDKIKNNGALSVSEYMEMCLYHPEHGYYTSRQPFGLHGDFTTAPEISGLFGEMLALWVIQKWQSLGKPENYTLVECGGGRGTLMLDVLTTIQKISPECYSSANINMVEISPNLRYIQQDTLTAHNIKWVEDISDLTTDCSPTILFANELLDAFPIDQFKRREDNKFYQLIIDLNSENKLKLNFKQKPQAIDCNYEYYEQHSKQLEWLQQLKKVLKNGSALLVDYGYLAPDSEANGDSLQAMHKHKFVDILYRPGECDITSHVNFKLVENVLGESQCSTLPMMAWLIGQGIHTRALSAIEKNPDTTQKAEIESALHRLLHPSEMGVMFKVLEYTP